MSLTILPLGAALSGLLFFPDSPRFYLSRGKNEEAAKSLQTVFVVNTSEKREHFPVAIIVCAVSLCITSPKDARINEFCTSL